MKSDVGVESRHTLHVTGRVWWISRLLVSSPRVLLHALPRCISPLFSFMEIDPALHAGPSKLIAGASTLPAQAINPPHPQLASGSTPTAAPGHPVPTAHFYSVEFPGYVQPTSAPLAIERLGGQHTIDTAFRRATGRDRVESLLELRLRPSNPYAHPIPGEVVPTSNIVLKVVKRKRRRQNGDAVQGYDAVGEYTVEAVGVVPKTARFRSECARAK